MAKYIGYYFFVAFRPFFLPYIIVITMHVFYRLTSLIVLHIFLYHDVVGYYFLLTPFKWRFNKLNVLHIYNKFF